MTSDDHHLKFKEHCKEKLERRRNSTGLQSLHKKIKRICKIQKAAETKHGALHYTVELFQITVLPQKLQTHCPHFLLLFLKGYARIRIQMVLLGHNIKPWHLE